MRSFLILGTALAALLAAGHNARATVLEQYEFQGQLGNETSVAPAVVSSFVIGANFTEASVLTPSAGANSINSLGWNRVGAAYTFGFSVAAGYTASVDQLVLSTRSSTTGPGFLSVLASVNGGAYMAVGSITQNSTNYNDEFLSITPVTGITSRVSFEIVAANQTAAGGGAVASGGTFRVGDYNPAGTATPFSINGTISALAVATVPEPTSAALVLTGLLALGRRARRPRL